MRRGRMAIASALLTSALVKVILPATPAQAAAPANDLIGGATAIAALPFSESLPYAEATYSGTDPSSCITPPPHSAYKTLWYTITPSVDERVRVTLPLEVGVDVFTGGPGSLVKFACHTYSWTFQPPFRWDAMSGTQYYVMVSVPGGWTDPVTVTFDEAPPGPANDDFGNATLIDTFDFTDTVDADNATEWFDDPVCTSWRAQHTFWYRYTPPKDARLHVDTLGSAMEGAIAIYKGTRGNLTQLTDCAYFISGQQPQISFKAKADVTYHIMVGTLADLTGPITFTFRSRLVSALSLKASRSVVRFGRSVRLSGHLKGFIAGSNPTVRIYRRGGSTPLASPTVDASGDFSTKLKPKVNTTYEARWNGDAHYGSAQSPRESVHVRVVIVAKLGRFYGKSGPYRLYHRATDPIYVVGVKPNHHGQNVIFRLEKRVSGSWLLYGTGSFPLNADSLVGVKVNHQRLAVGVDYRIRATFQSDGDHVGDSSAWSYFRMTA
jgi:hypothetical protein